MGVTEPKLLQHQSLVILAGNRREKTECLGLDPDRHVIDASVPNVPSGLIVAQTCIRCAQVLGDAFVSSCFEKAASEASLLVEEATCSKPLEYSSSCLARP